MKLKILHESIDEHESLVAMCKLITEYAQLKSRVEVGISTISYRGIVICSNIGDEGFYFNEFEVKYYKGDNNFSINLDRFRMFYKFSDNKVPTNDTIHDTVLSIDVFKNLKSEFEHELSNATFSKTGK